MVNQSVKIIDQTEIENLYSIKHLRELIRTDLTTIETNIAMIQTGVSLLEEWLSQTHSSEKQERLLQLKRIDLEELVTSIFEITALCDSPELFVGICGQVAHKLGFSDHSTAIVTTAEICTILCYTRAFELIKDGKYAPWTVKSLVELNQQTFESMKRVMFLPPMVCKPEPLTSAWESPYLSFNEPVMTGRTEFTHSGDIGLDVINQQTSVALSLCPRFLSFCKELEPDGSDEDKMEFKTQQVEQWSVFKSQSEKVYKLLIDNGNEFYMGWKTDQRLRIYATGYHINPQGRPYKKAMIELAKKEPIEGNINDLTRL